MVQDQLIEYITSQLKAGVSGETIKATLVAAGWQSPDVDDTLKKVQSSAASPVSTSAPAQPMGASTAANVNPKPTSAMKVEPQTIRVSDLVSASTSVSTASVKAADARAEATKKFLTPNILPTGAAIRQTPAGATTAVRSSSRGPLTAEIILGVLMVIFGALAAYFYFENQGLAGQVATLSSQSTGVSTQVTALQSQLNASTTALSAEVASATAQNEQLALELSFYAAPLGSAAASTSTTMLNGYVSGGGTKSYVITTPDGAKVLVTNSKDPKVVAALQSLVGTTTVPFAGTYTPGTDAITLTVINGVSLTAPPAVSETASSTPSSTTATEATTTTTTTAPGFHHP